MSSLQTARTIVEQVINDSRAEKIQAVVSNYINKENTAQQGYKISNGGRYRLLICEDFQTNEIVIQRSVEIYEDSINTGRTQTTMHYFERNFDQAAEFIINQLLKHFKE